MTEGADFTLRTIWLGDIDHDEAGRVIRQFRLMCTQGDDPITLMIMSHGGDWTATMAIYDVIREADVKVVCEVVGMCMSGGVVVAQACDWRFIHENAIVMAHNGSHQCADESTTFERWGKYAKTSRDIMHKIFARRSGKPQTYWRKKLQAGDVILNSDEAVDSGLFDQVLRPEDV